MLQGFITTARFGKTSKSSGHQGTAHQAEPALGGHARQQEVLRLQIEDPASKG